MPFHYNFVHGIPRSLVGRPWIPYIIINAGEYFQELLHVRLGTWHQQFKLNPIIHW